jgi:hypothetical protein
MDESDTISWHKKYKNYRDVKFFHVFTFNRVGNITKNI